MMHLGYEDNLMSTKIFPEGSIYYNNNFRLSFRYNMLNRRCTNIYETIQLLRQIWSST